MQKIKINSINPYIRRAMHSILPKGHIIKRRAIFDYELIYIEKGSFTLRYAGEKYHCTEGTFILLCPGVPHSFRNIRSDLYQPHIHFDITYRDDSEMTPISFKDPAEFSASDQKMLRHNFFEEQPAHPIIHFSDKKKALILFYGIIDTGTSALIRKGMLTELIGMIIDDNFAMMFSQSDNAYTPAKLIKDYIDAGQGLNARLEDFEKQFSYSKFYLEKQFKAEYGIGIIAYRNKSRLELAHRLLETLSVTEVSERLGYSSIYVFSRAYKNFFGFSPSSKAKGTIDNV